MPAAAWISRSASPGRKGLRQRLRASGQRDRRGRVVAARAEELLVSEEAASRCSTSCDRRAREPVRAELGDVTLEFLEGCLSDRLAEVRGQGCKVATVGVHRAWRTLRGEKRQEAVDLGITIHSTGFARGRATPVQRHRCTPRSLRTGVRPRTWLGGTCLVAWLTAARSSPAAGWHDRGSASRLFGTWRGSDAGRVSKRPVPRGQERG